MDNCQILKKFNNLVENEYNEILKENLFFAKKSLGLNEKDVKTFIGRDSLDENDFSIWKLSAMEAARLTELSNPSDETLKLIDMYKKNNEKGLNEKVSKLLSLFDIKDEESLDRLIDTITDVRSSIYEVENETAEMKADSKPSEDNQCKCASQTECKCEEKRASHNESFENKKPEGKGHAEMSYAYYDSESMDEPKTETVSFDFDPTNLLANEFSKRLGKLLGQNR